MKKFNFWGESHEEQISFVIDVAAHAAISIIDMSYNMNFNDQH